MKLFILFIAVACILFKSCRSTGKVTKRKAGGLDTITNINDLPEKQRAVYKNKNNEYYIMRYEPDTRDSTEEEENDTIQLTSNRGGQLFKTINIIAVNKRCDSDNFDGSNRKGAKLSVSSSGLETFATLTSLISSLANANDMAAAISGSNAPRITEEDRNVRVKKTWLYAYSRQTDEDFHVIVGNTKNPRATTKYFNIEISGLPPAGAATFNDILSSRNSFLTKATENLCKSGYFFYEKPLRVDVTGSLFYDKQHHGDDIGPGSARPPDAWEIHPVTKLRFY